jgi:hypothetical protein
MGITVNSSTDVALAEFKALMAAAQTGVTSTSLNQWFRKRMGFGVIEIYNHTELIPRRDRDGMRLFVSGEYTIKL